MGQVVNTDVPVKGPLESQKMAFGFEQTYIVVSRTELRELFLSKTPREWPRVWRRPTKTWDVT